MAQNGTVPELPEAISKPPPGIVLPPRDIRAIVEKTAGYVARNGPVFEDRIRDKEHSNSKFSFLSPNDAYAPFYQWRLDEIRAGRGTTISAGRADGPPPAEKPKGPPPPPEFTFSARMPNISALDLEVVKLTALHVARKGKSWMTALSQREARNPQFDFLRPQNSLYNFFSHLVDQYSVLLQTGPEGQKAEQARMSTLQSNLQHRFRILDLAKQRAEYVKWKETQKQQKEEAEEAEKLAYAQIDWHDFVVVETVLFTDADEHAELPPPTSLNDLQSASLEQKAMMSLARSDMRIEEAMPTDDMSSYAYAYGDSYGQAQQPQNDYVQPIPQATPAYLTTTPLAPPQIPIPTYPPAPPSAPSPTPVPAANTAPPPMRIKSSYTPLAQSRTARPATALCPNCGEQIPLAELDNHMRVELLDPRWKEQRAKADARFASTNLGGTDVAANLKRLRARVGGGGEADPVAESAARVLDEEERRKRARLDSGSGFDGALDATPYATGMPVVETVPKAPPPPQGKDLSLQEQINRIHQKAKT